MKIAHVFWSLTFGGVETMLVNIANEQAKLGNDVTVILINEWYEQSLAKAVSGNVNFISMGRKLKSRSPKFIYKLNKTLDGLNPDVVHLHSSALYGFILNKKYSRVSCSTLHALPQGALRRDSLMGKVSLWNALRHSGNITLIDKVPKVFSISNAVHDELLDKYGVESVVVNNGIIARNFKCRNSEARKDIFRIVQVSRLEHDRKGQDLLIQAVAKLQDYKMFVDFIGDGDSLEYLKRLSKELGVSKNVNFLGKRAQGYISEHLCEYDLFVQPSRKEGFGLTVAEALSARVPVLVSSGQGPAEVCCGDKYGWLFENGSVDDLAEKIEYIYNHYLEATNKAREGQQYASQMYDVSVTARKYLENY